MWAFNSKLHFLLFFTIASILTFNNTLAIDTKCVENSKLVAEPLESVPADRLELAQELYSVAVKGASQIPSKTDLKVLTRAIQEVEAASRVFAPYQGIPKITIFGSARTPETHPRYQSAKSLAAKASEEGWMSITGGGPGIMRAGNQGTPEKTFGLNITLPFEQKPNPFIDPSRLVDFKYFFARKLFLLKEASAIATYPGGFGTLDEAWEVVTLLQTGKTELIPFVFVDTPEKPFWKPILAAIESQMQEEGYISRNDSALYKLVNGPDEALEHVRKFYSNYTSMKKGDGQTTLYFKKPISSATIRNLNRNFKDLLKSGDFKESKTGDQFALTFDFDNKQYGTLRKLIDFMNDQ